MMDQPGFEHLRRQVRLQQDALLADEATMMRARAAIGAAARMAVRRGRRRRTAWLLTGALGTCATAAAVLLIVLRVHAPLSFQVAGQVDVRIGQWFGHAEGAGDQGASSDISVRFSDGTRMVVAQSGRARVAELSRNGARVELIRGALHADVVHRPGALWQVQAGPYQVRVTGTRFRVAWTPQAGIDQPAPGRAANTGRLQLQMDQGEVVVTGPSLGAARVLHAGERLEVDNPEPQRRALQPAATGSTPPAAVVEPPGEQPRPEVRRADVRPRNTTIPPAPAAAWRALAVSERWSESLAAAERTGFSDLCRKVPREDLVLLGNMARFAGADLRAMEAFSALRQRFPRSAEAAFGAYALGRLSFDRQRDYGAAARWFRLYLSEQPSGELEREAAGRLIEALQRTGDGAAAKQAAQDYLERHPNGPHARLARSIMGG